MSGVRERIEAFVEWCWNYFGNHRPIQILDQNDEGRIDWNEGIERDECSGLPIVKIVRQLIENYPRTFRRFFMILSNKVAIVTGGNSGIGKAIVLELARQGANIGIDYVSHPDATEELEKQVASLGDKAIGVDADVSKVADLERLIATTVKAFGRLDIMVNNAGIETRTSILETTEQQYDKVLQVNLKSAFFGTQLAAKQMIKQGGGGHIVNITSVHEDWPMPGNIAYCLSKGGMRMLTRTAGVELAPHNILVVGVGPGAVATPINISTMQDPAKMAKLDAAIPLGRMAKPEEIASVVAMMAGGGASYITATTIFADGGLMQSSPGL